ncbi:MAG: LamG domain-containing protein [Bacteroidales bacterium]|nr:LamG domain-containing protein [Bacteroidales bacterium]
MKTRLSNSSLSLAIGVLVAVGAISCNDEWGQQDPPSGNQVYPTLQTVATYAFDENEEGDVTYPSGFKSFGLNADVNVIVDVDEELSSNVLYLENGYASFDNGLNSVTCQAAASFTFWMKQPLTVDDEGNSSSQDLTTGLITFVTPYADGTVFSRAEEDVADDADTTTETVADADTEYGYLSFTANGMIHYDTTVSEYIDNDPSDYGSGYISPDEWHYVAVIIREDGYGIYVDGLRKVDKVVTNFDCMKMVSFINKAKKVFLNYTPGIEENSPLVVDDITLYRNEITSKEIAIPKKGNKGNTGGSSFVSLPDPIYYLDFEHGLGSATIQGSGKIMDFGGNFGKAFQNVGGSVRSNFLVLPSDALMRTGETEEMTVTFWVNATNAGESSGYMWSPIFSAYSEYCPDGNHAPLLCCQYRGIVANNMNGADNVGGNWCDYTDAQCEQGAVTIRHNDTDWLADHEWHMYTAVFTKTTAAVYFDDELINSWVIDGVSDGARCEIFGSSDLTYICVGGNQSWWADPDLGAAFDDIAIYNKAFTQEQVSTLYGSKTIPDPIYSINFEYGIEDASIQGSGKIMDFGGNFGKAFQNVGGSVRSNFLVLPSDALMRTGETEEMTVTFWVNATNAGESSGYMWSPIFSAYSEYCPDGNHAPLLCCQYRGIVANNMNGADNVGGNWCDYTDAQCEQGAVTIRHNDTDWLADHEWHMYTAVFTKTTAAVYFDDELINSWVIDGVSDGARCEIFGSSDLTYICVGGNQSWWADPDLGAAFDDVKIYNYAFTAEDVANLFQLK